MRVCYRQELAGVEENKTEEWNVISGGIIFAKMFMITIYNGFGVLKTIVIVVTNCRIIYFVFTPFAFLT